jgi:hypothetical protein
MNVRITISENEAEAGAWAVVQIAGPFPDVRDARLTQSTLLHLVADVARSLGATVTLQA